MNGYDFTGTTATTYLGTSSVSCATGYDGTASPTTIICEASGSWTAVSGCIIMGNTDFVQILFKYIKINVQVKALYFFVNGSQSF